MSIWGPEAYARHFQKRREALANQVIRDIKSLTTKLSALEKSIRALWVEFDNLTGGEAILGCRTKKEFCERKLNRTPRAIQYMLAGGNPSNHRQEPQEHQEHQEPHDSSETSETSEIISPVPESEPDVSESEPSFTTETPEDFSNLPVNLPPDPVPVTPAPVRRSWTREHERPIELKVGMRVSYQGMLFELQMCADEDGDIILEVGNPSMLTLTMMEVKE